MLRPEFSISPIATHNATTTRRVITASVVAGFTIIEVMIVLAIAALILLIVFLAIPALQRNSHNTQYKKDASSILAAVNEFVPTNSGRPPSASSCSGTADAAGQCGLTTAPNNAMQIWQNANKPTNITALNIVAWAGGATVPAGISLSNAFLYTNANCPAGTITSGAAITQSLGTRAMALFFGIEGPGNATILQCQAT